MHKTRTHFCYTSPMPENPFNPVTQPEKTNPKANEKLVAELLSGEDAAAYAALNQKITEVPIDTADHTLTEDEKGGVNEAKLITPEKIIELINESGSPAELDTTFEGGIVSIDIPPDITDWKSAEAAFSAADNGSASGIWKGWKEKTWTSPETIHLYIIVLSYNVAPDTIKSGDEINADMDRIGLRPLTLEEMAIAGIQEPKFTKTSGKTFFGLTEYVDHHCPYLGQSSVAGLSDVARFLGEDRWDTGWLEGDRFLCVRK